VPALGRPVAGSDWLQRQLPLLWMAPALLLVGLFLLWPLTELVGLSFTSWDGYGAITFDGFRTWTSLFGDPNFQAAFRHTMLWTALCATLPVVGGFLLAVAFSRAGRGVGAVARALAVVPLLLPQTVVAATWQIVYNPLYGPLDGTLRAIGLGGLALGWLGGSRLSFWSLFAVALWSSTGFSVLIFTAGIRTIDRSFFDLARVEGANVRQEIVHVLIPACRRSAALALVITVATTSNVLDLLRALTNGGPANATIMLPLDMYNRSFSGGNVGQGAADACIEVAIGLGLAIVVLLLARKHAALGGEGEYGEAGTRPVAMVAALVAAFALILPLLWDVMAALTRGRTVAIEPLSVALRHPSLTPFLTSWQAGIGTGLWESLAVASVVVAFSLLLALPAAFGLSRLKGRPLLRGVLLTLLLVTMLQPGETYIIPLFYLLLQLGLIDTATGLVLVEVSRTLPFTIILLWLTMESLPGDILGAGEIDAGGGVRLLRSVIAPLTAPVAAAAALWVFVSSWSDYSLPTLLLSNSSLQTAPMALTTFIGTHDTQFNLLAAGTLWLVAPVIVALVVVYGPAARGLRAAGRALSS